MKIWITGSKGQLGTELFQQQDKLPEAEFLFTDIEELDLTRKEAVLKFAKQEKPGWIINCAAYTAVDRAEEEPEKTMLLNRDIPAYLTEAALQNHARLIHISTDFVFDGKTNRPYTEKDAPGPLSVYAKSKYAGELEVLKHPSNIVIRTSWLYSVYGNNFVKTMLKLGAERHEIGVVRDQVGSPTAGPDLASALLKMIASISEHPEKVGGIYHYSNAGICSWYEFAAEIMRLAGLPCKVKPIPTSAYPLPAKRPAYSVMDLSKIRNEFGLVIPEWRESLKRILPEILGAEHPGGAKG